MDTSSLKTLLQVHLSSNSQAVLHLPFILSVLNDRDFKSPEHLPKWIARVGSLVQSQDGGARWAGLSIALKTAMLSRDVMVECAQSWVTVAMHLVSKNETVPVLKSAIRLLRYLFTSATDIPEYQRQICTPNVPKFSTTLASLAEKSEDMCLKVLALDSLAHIVPIYPTLHRALHQVLTNLVMLYLNGSAPQPLSSLVVQSASLLHSVLHLCGGKVGAATEWRRAVDEALAFCSVALSQLEVTLSAGSNSVTPSPIQANSAGPFSLSLDRLRIGAIVLKDLLTSPNSRPVMLPIGSIVELCIALLSWTATDKVEGHADLTHRSLEVSTSPFIYRVGCDLVKGLAQCVGHLLAPYCLRLLFYITHHLEQSYSPSQRLCFLHSAHTILACCGFVCDTLQPSRLARAVLPSIVAVLSPERDPLTNAVKGASSTASKKGKKRVRGYEGDEIFKMTRSVLLRTQEHKDIALASINVVRELLTRGPLSEPIHSLTARVALSFYMALPHVPPALLSFDPAFHSTIHREIAAVCVELGYGPTSVMSKSLGLVVGTALQNTHSQRVFSELELILHPRAPPLVRSIPHVELLSLRRAEESQEEAEAVRVLMSPRADESCTPIRSKESPFIPIASQPSTRAYSAPPVPPATVELSTPHSVPAQSPTQGLIQKMTEHHPKELQETPVAATEGLESRLPTNASPSIRSPSLQPAALNPSFVAIPAGIHASLGDQDEDEPMPSIDLDSDSD